MIRLLFSILCLCMALGSRAQVASWKVRPTMDEISFDAVNKVFVGKSGDSTYVWNKEGRQLVGTDCRVTGFREECCLHLDRDNGGLCGFTNIKGDYRKIGAGDGKRYKVDEHFPYFSFGLLLVYNTDDGLYYYVNKQGKVVSEGYQKAYPFFMRHASVVTFKDAEKKKGTIAKLINTRFEDVEFTRNGKVLKEGAFDFISSVSPERYALCLDGKSFYIYDSSNTLDDECVRYSTDNSSDKKTFVNLVDKVFNPVPTADGGFTISTDQGTMTFDGNAVLVSTDWLKPRRQVEFKSSNLDAYLKPVVEDGLVGLTWNGNGDYGMVMPAQFEEVGDVMERLAIVKLNGKFGIVEGDNLHAVSITLNNGQPLEFTHSTTECIMGVDIPGRVYADDIQEIRSTAGLLCVPDLSRIKRISSNDVSRFTVPCKVSVPKGMSADVSKHTCIFSIKYQDLVVMPSKTEFQTQYRVPFTLALSSPVLNKDTVRFDLDVICDGESSELYNYEAKVVSDANVTCDVKPFSSSRFSIAVSNVKAGETQFDIVVNEEDCPSMTVPYLLTYTPAEKKVPAKISLQRRVVEQTEGGGE